MSKRRRLQTNRAGNILVIPDKRDHNREQEILAKPVSAFYGTVVARMMDRLHAPDCTALEAQNIGLALQQLLRGDAALLNNMNDPAVSEQVARLKQQAAAIDKANDEFETNQEKFVQGVFDKADKIAPIGDKRSQVIAQGVQKLQQAREIAKGVARTQKVGGELKNGLV